jgi:hypothetical protein
MYIATQNKRKSAGRERAKIQVINNTQPDPTTPIPPSAARFVPKCDREVWADVWLRGVKNLPQLTYSNKGFGLLAIEDAIRTEIRDRLSRAERLERNVTTMRRAA